MPTLKPPPTKPRPRPLRIEREPLTLQRLPQAELVRQARAFVEATIRRRNPNSSPQRRGVETRRINTASVTLSLNAPEIADRLSEIYAVAEDGRDADADARRDAARAAAAEAHRVYLSAQERVQTWSEIADRNARLAQQAAQPAADAAALAFVAALEAELEADDRANEADAVAAQPPELAAAGS